MDTISVSNDEKNPYLTLSKKELKEKTDELMIELCMMKRTCWNCSKTHCLDQGEDVEACSYWKGPIGSDYYQMKCDLANLRRAKLLQSERSRDMSRRKNK